MGFQQFNTGKLHHNYQNHPQRANKEWYGTDDDDFSKINVEFCLNQIRKWAKALAEQEAETDEQGKKLSYLRSLKMKMEDDVMELIDNLETQV